MKAVLTITEKARSESALFFKKPLHYLKECLLLCQVPATTLAAFVFQGINLSRADRSAPKKGARFTTHRMKRLMRLLRLWVLNTDPGVDVTHGYFSLELFLLWWKISSHTTNLNH